MNSVFAAITTINQPNSVRSVNKRNKKAQRFQEKYLTTAFINSKPALGAVFQGFKEQFGNDKNTDLQFSFSHSLFASAFPDAKVSNIQIDKKGNHKLQMNAVVSFLIETAPGTWETYRVFYLTIVFKYQIAIKLEEEKELALKYKSLELTNLKIFKQGEELEHEQMMI